MPDCKFTKKPLFHTSSFMYFAFIFSERVTIKSSEEVLKVCQHTFFQKLKANSSVTCNLLVQLWFIQVNFLYAEYGIWRCLEYGFSQINKLEFFVSCSTFLLYTESEKKALQEYPSFCWGCML